MKTAFFFRAFAAFLFVALLVSRVQGTGSPAPECGTLTGVLRDATTHEPIPGTNVVLLDSRHNTLVGSTKTRPDGTFRLEKVPFGQYTFHATVLGYQPLQPKLVFSPKQAHVSVGTINLHPLTAGQPVLAYAGR